MINIPHHTAKINISKIGFKTNLTHKSKKTLNAVNLHSRSNRQPSIIRRGILPTDCKPKKCHSKRLITVNEIIVKRFIATPSFIHGAIPKPNKKIGIRANTN